MSLRKRIVIGIGLILLILGIGKPLTEAAVQALKPDAVQTSGTDVPKLCKMDCPKNSKPWNIPFRSWFLKKPIKDNGDLRGWETNEKPKKIKDLKPQRNNIIIVGLKNVEQVLNGKGRSSSLMLLMSLLVLLLVTIIGYIVWRKRRKNQTQNEDFISTDVSLQPAHNDFVLTEEQTDLPDAWIRKQLIHFNRILPVRLRRYDTETVQEWCQRIKFQPSYLLMNTYLLERYTERAIPLSDQDKRTIQGEFGSFTHQLD